MLYSVGLHFWKVGSRKIYAVQQTESELDPPRKKKPKRDRIVITDSDSDDDEFTPRLHKKVSISSFDTEKVLSELRNVSDMVKDIHKDVHDVFTINAKMKIPAGLHRMLTETFRCTIFRSSPIKPDHSRF